MIERVFVLRVSEANDPWEPLVFAHKNTAINAGLNILAEWFPDDWTPRRAEIAKRTLEKMNGFTYVRNNGQTIKLKIFSCGIQ